MIGDYYKNLYGRYYIVTKETSRTKTLMEFEPMFGDFERQFHDPCHRETLVVGVLSYLTDKTFSIRLCKDGEWKYKGNIYCQIQLPYYYCTYVD